MLKVKKKKAKIWYYGGKALPLHPLNEKHRGVEQLVARQAHNLEVARSNPASATKEAASALFKGLAASSSELLGQISDTFHQRCGVRQTTLKKCFPHLNATKTLLKEVGL